MFTKLETNFDALCALGQVERVKTALARGPGEDVNSRNKYYHTVLMCTARYPSENHISILRLLLEQPLIDLNLTDEKGNTALMFAAHFENIEAVRLLLEQPSIEVNLEDISGHTALHLATVKGNIDAVKLLLVNERVNVNSQNVKRLTALMRAAARSTENHVSILRLLLEQPSLEVNLANEEWM